MRWAIRLTLCIAVVATSGRGLGQTGSSGVGATSDEAVILQSIYDSNKNEKDMATLASNKSRSQDVKDVSARLLEDHRNADAQLRAYAKKRQIDLDASARKAARDVENELWDERRSRSLGSGTGEYAFTSENAIKRSKEAETALGKLRKLDGSEFDRAFAQNVITDHQTLIDLLKNARSQPNDEMNRLIDSLLPDIEQHLTLAQKLASK